MVPEVAAAVYGHAVRASGGLGLQLLGLGTNGHVGFNEPPVVRTAPATW